MSFLPSDWVLERGCANFPRPPTDPPDPEPEGPPGEPPKPVSPGDPIPRDDGAGGLMDPRFLIPGPDTPGSPPDPFEPGGLDRVNPSQLKGRR